jgi:hypothetical protein
MSRRTAAWLSGIACALLATAAYAATAPGDDALGFERTPPRLSFTDGAVSFWRVGAGDWTPAAVNTPLAAGDQLYTAAGANLELQVGARAYVRAGEQTQLGLTSLEPDFLQLRVTSGHVSLDLRSLTSGQTIEVDTPGGAFTIEHTGYYRVEVGGDTTTFTTRRGGRASVTPALGASAVIAPSEQVVVAGGDAPQVETYAAPELDAWDRWNYARTDDQIDAVSARYVPSGVYGADDLDQHGDWRLVPTYGAVWVPRGIAPGWAPYSTGRWLYDPYYGWTWVDAAPWGWAPYHYGRWVHVSGYWGWCPGPIVARPYYAPALVAFFGGGGFSIGVSVGTPFVGWVALGWGEPLVPWWGPHAFRGHPHWAGWGGPRVVNNIVVKNKTIINVNDIHVYQNTHVHDAIVEVDRKHFGRRNGDEAHFVRADARKVKPLYGDLDVKPDHTSVTPETGRTARPPRKDVERPVVATREPRQENPPGLETHTRRRQNQGSETSGPPVTPAARVVEPPREGGHISATERPPFGTQGENERRIPPPAPRFQKSERLQTGAAPQGEAATAVVPPATPATHGESGAEGRSRARGRFESAPQAPETVTEPAPPLRTRSERSVQHGSASSEARTLPGEPANRVYPRTAPPSMQVERAPRSQAPQSGAANGSRGGSSHSGRGSGPHGRGQEGGEPARME